MRIFFLKDKSENISKFLFDDDDDRILESTKSIFFRFLWYISQVTLYYDTFGKTILDAGLPVPYLWLSNCNIWTNYPEIPTFYIKLSRASS